CAARNPGCLPNRRDAAPARCLRFARRKQSTPAFVQKRRKRIETGFDRGGVDHIARVAFSPIGTIQFPRFVPCVLAPVRILLCRFGYQSSGPKKGPSAAIRQFSRAPGTAGGPHFECATSRRTSRGA